MRLTYVRLEAAVPQDVVRQVPDEVALPDDGLPHVGQATVMQRLQRLRRGPPPRPMPLQPPLLGYAAMGSLHVMPRLFPIKMPAEALQCLNWGGGPDPHSLGGGAPLTPPERKTPFRLKPWCQPPVLEGETILELVEKKTNKKYFHGQGTRGHQGFCYPVFRNLKKIFFGKK